MRRAAETSNMTPLPRRPLTLGRIYTQLSLLGIVYEPPVKLASS